MSKIDQFSLNPWSTVTIIPPKLGHNCCKNQAWIKPNKRGQLVPNISCIVWIYEHPPALPKQEDQRGGETQETEQLVAKEEKERRVTMSTVQQMVSFRWWLAVSNKYANSLKGHVSVIDIEQRCLPSQEIYVWGSLHKPLFKKPQVELLWHKQVSTHSLTLVLGPDGLG